MLKVIFFGFTGLGSAVLKGLIRNKNVKVVSVYTKKYSDPYPYYEEKQVGEICDEAHIRCYYDCDINDETIIHDIAGKSPELIVVSSFNQIISKRVMDIPSRGIINFHPSMLPKYRGPYPEQAALLNDERETGVTVHNLTEKIDRGDILIQKKIQIHSDDDYSKLKRKLANLAFDMVDKAIELFSKNDNPPVGKEQDENEASFYSKFKEEEGYLEQEADVMKIKNKVRALNPFPGTSYLVNGERRKIDEYEIIDYAEKDGVIVTEESIDIHSRPHGIRLSKKK